MDGRFEFREHVVAHLVAKRAEFFGIGQFQRGVETAPEDHTGHEAREDQNAKAEHGTWPDQHAPQLNRELPHPCEKPRPRGRLFERAHRAPPGAARLSRVSISTKSLLTGGFDTLWGTWH